jgi:UDP-glucuronate decarboxylase
MDSPDPSFTGPLNLGNTGEFIMLGLAELVLKLTGSSSSLDFKPLPKDDPAQRRPDLTLAKERLDWEPRVPLRDGLVETIRYFESVLGKNG